MTKVLSSFNILTRVGGIVVREVRKWDTLDKLGLTNEVIKKLNNINICKVSDLVYLTKSELKKMVKEYIGPKLSDEEATLLYFDIVDKVSASGYSFSTFEQRKQANRNHNRKGQKNNHYVANKSNKKVKARRRYK